MESRRSSASSEMQSEVLKFLLRGRRASRPIGKYQLNVCPDEIVDYHEGRNSRTPCKLCWAQVMCREHEHQPALLKLAVEVMADDCHAFLRRVALAKFNAIQTLPPELQLCSSGLPRNSLGVYVKGSAVAAETWYGPYLGKRLTPHEARQLNVERTDYLWEVYDAKRIIFYVDGFNFSAANWMRFVRCTSQRELANVRAVQHGLEIHYQLTRELLHGEELFVWYSPEFYRDVHGIPVGLQSSYGRDSSTRVERRVHHDHPSASAITSRGGGAMVGSGAPVLGQQPTPTPATAAAIVQYQQHHHMATSPPGVMQPIMVIPHGAGGPRMVSDGGGGKVAMMHMAGPQWGVQVVPAGHMPGHHPTAVTVGQPMRMPIPALNRPAVATAMGGGIAVGGGGVSLGGAAPVCGIGMDVKRQCHRWECSQCEEVFGQRLNMEKHLCPLGEIAKPYRCMMCGTTFTNGQFLQGHVSNECRACDGPQEKPYACEYCRKAFTGTTTLMNHIRTHYEEKPRKCDRCGEEYKNVAAMTRHICPDGESGGGGGGGGSGGSGAEEGEGGGTYPAAVSATTPGASGGGEGQALASRLVTAGQPAPGGAQGPGEDTDRRSSSGSDTRNSSHFRFSSPPHQYQQPHGIGTPRATTPGSRYPATLLLSSARDQGAGRVPGDIAPSQGRTLTPGGAPPGPAMPTTFRQEPSSAGSSVGGGGGGGGGGMAALVPTKRKHGSRSDHSSSSSDDTSSSASHRSSTGGGSSGSDADDE